MRPLILAIDDLEDDLLLLSRAFATVAPSVEIKTFLSGKVGLAYLMAAQAGSPQHRLPQLIIVDLKMPCMSGFEVLTALEEMSIRPEIPVIMLSSSPLEDDIARAKRLGVASFCTKPNQVVELRQMAARWAEFFLKTPPIACGSYNLPHQFSGRSNQLGHSLN